MRLLAPRDTCTQIPDTLIAGVMQMVVGIRVTPDCTTSPPDAIKQSSNPVSFYSFHSFIPFILRKHGIQVPVFHELLGAHNFEEPLDARKNCGRMDTKEIIITYKHIFPYPLWCIPWLTMILLTNVCMCLCILCDCSRAQVCKVT